MSLRRALAVLIALPVLLLASGSSARALSPPRAPLAEIYFSNAGRIVSIKADGSKRKVLTRKRTQLLGRGDLADVIQYGDDLPAVSPDGSKLAFVRTFPKKPWQQVLITDRDGRGATEIPGGVNGDVETLGWMPDGRLLITVGDYRYSSNGTEGSTFRVIAANLATGKRRVLLEQKMKGWVAGDDELLAQEVSPDGRLLLYTRNFGEDKNGENQIRLRIRDLETGKERLLASGAEAGSFSPDGQRVAFTRMCVDTEGYAHCQGSGDERNGIWTIGIDGSDRRLIVTGDGQYTSPDWGPGGGHIIFASSRNFPDERENASEIYSVRPDGVCLTWLTNGSPESLSPTWAPETAVRTDPGARCGGAGREPLVEARPAPVRKGNPRPRFWAGPQVSGRLLSSLSGLANDYGSEIYRYGDCPFFESSHCRKPLTLELSRACVPITEIRLPRAGRKATRKHRGVKVTRRWTERGKLSGTTLRTGPVNIGIGSAWLDVDDVGGRPASFAQHLAVIDALRPIGETLKPGSKLPATSPLNCRGKRR